MLDPSAKAALDLAATFEAVPLSQLTPAEAREQFNRRAPMFQGPKEAVEAVWDARAGNVPLRLYRGRGCPEAAAPCLVYFHGGGWVLGNRDSHDGLCRRLANERGGLVVSVEYRLAPEAPFPAAIEDGATTLHHLAAEAESLGIDPARLGVSGDSAGGNIAAALALLAREGAIPPIAFQILIYPVTDVAQSQESYRRYAEGYGLTTEAMAWYREQYLPRAADHADPRASPLRVADLSGLAPAFILTAGHDPLHDEARDYALRLRAAGVAVTLDENPGQIHGFLSMDRLIPEGQEAVRRAIRCWQAMEASL